MKGRDSLLVCIMRRVNIDRAPADVNRALVGALRACENLYKCRLSCAVIANQRDNLIFLDVDRDPVQRPIPTERLNDPPRAQKGMCCGEGVCTLPRGSPWSAHSTRS